MLMKISVFDRLGVKSSTDESKKKHNLISKVQKPSNNPGLFLNKRKNKYDKISSDYDVIVGNYNMELNSLRHPFINYLHNSRKRKIIETTSGILPSPLKQTCHSSKPLNELIVSSLMVNQTVSALGEKTNGPSTNEFQNAKENITITVSSGNKPTIVINVDKNGRNVKHSNVSNDVKNLSSNTESSKLEQSTEEDLVFFRKITITPNKNEKLANNHGPKESCDIEDIQNNSDQNELLKMSKHCQSNLEETEPLYVVGCENETQNSKQTDEEQKHIKCDVDSSSEDETQSHPCRRLELERSLESKTKRSKTLPIIKSKQRLTGQKPKASQFWERVLRTPAFWKEELHYSVSKTFANCSSVDEECGSVFQVMLAQFRTCKVQQKMKANAMHCNERVEVNSNDCLSDASYESNNEDRTELCDTME